jgi:hypothetical protein
MLLVPIGALLLARSLIPDWSRFGALGGGGATSAPEVPSTDLALPDIHGRVLDGEGNQISGAAIHLVSAAVPPAVVAETKSRQDGSFAFAKVMPGSVRIVADHDPEGVVTSSEVAVGEAPTSDVLLVLSAAEAIHGAVVDGDDHPIAGATIAAVGVAWDMPPATSDAAGEFRLTTVPHDATSLVATARGFRTASASLAARAQSTEPTEHVVRLRLVAAPPIEGDVVDEGGQPVAARVVACEGERFAAETVSGRDGSFELPPSAIGCVAVASRDDSGGSEPVTLTGGRVTLHLQAGGAIEGVVVDERGSAVPTFSVGVESFSAARGRSGSGGGRSKGFDDARGAFRLESLAPGTYVLTASASGKPPARSEPIAVTSGTPTRGVRIVLSAGGIVVGHVYDEQRAPLEGVDLGFDQVSSIAVSRAHARTDETGAYRLEGAPVGPFTLRASKAGFRLQMTAGLHIEPGATLTEDLTLKGTDGGSGGLELGGVGATIERTGAGIIFANVFPGDPADKAGLRSGDHILKIDGEPTDGMSLADVLQRLRGTPGTTVGVSVRRGSDNQDLFDAVVSRTFR